MCVCVCVCVCARAYLDVAHLHSLPTLCSGHPTNLTVVACGPWHDNSVVPGPSRLALLCTAHAL